MYEMTDLQYRAVYNVLSFSLASMMATTMYLWFRATAVKDHYASAVFISGLVTFIAAYHYILRRSRWQSSVLRAGCRPSQRRAPASDELARGTFFGLWFPVYSACSSVPLFPCERCASQATATKEALHALQRRKLQQRAAIE